MASAWEEASGGAIKTRIFVILAVAMRLTNYLIDAEIPQQAAEWIGTEIEIFRSVIPFFFVLVAVVLIVTYIPALTTWAASPVR